MLNVFKSLTLFILLVLNITSAQAAFVLNGTRFIYNEGQKSIDVRITNNEQATYGGQAWVESIDNKQAHYAIYPSLFKVEAGKTQNIKLVNIEQLPKDRESLSYLYVQELPPAVKGNSNALALALNIRVKVLYRPKSLPMGRAGAEQKITVQQRGKQVALVNTTPFYFAVVSVKGLNPSNQIDRELAAFKPGSTILLPADIVQNNKVEIVTINDFGGQESYELAIQ